MIEDILDKVLISQQDLESRADTLGKEISETYAGVDCLTVLCILNGALVFTSDLIRSITVPLELRCVQTASYFGGTVTKGRVQINIKDFLGLSNRNLLIVDDILDTGLTLSKLTSQIKLMNSPLSLRTCVLLSKKKTRTVPFTADFVGFEIEDEFVVGYGLDYNEKHRNLPVVGVPKIG